MQNIINKEGEKKSVLEMLIDEVVIAGITDICVVIQPNNEKTYNQVLGQYGHYVKFVYQAEPLGYGHALYCAKDFISNEFFLHLVGDHLYVNRSEVSCAKHLVDFAKDINVRCLRYNLQGKV